MSNQQVIQYVKKCTSCGADILMKNIEGKWSALENGGSTTHMCRKKIGVVTGGKESVVVLDKPDLQRSIDNLTATINILITLMTASTGAERNHIKKQLVV